MGRSLYEKHKKNNDALKLTPTPPPTTDESAFEKLRCAAPLTAELKMVTVGIFCKISRNGNMQL